MEIITENAQETQSLGEKIGNSLVMSGKSETAAVITLSGELGSGKTTLMQGFAKSLGIGCRIVSPTFIVVRQYEVSTGEFRRLYHIDLYRIKKFEELRDFGFDEMLADAEAIVAIEWPEKIRKLLPAQRTDVQFGEVVESRRIITINSPFFPAQKQIKL